MACDYKHKVLKLLKDELENELENEMLEKHIEECVECSALVEGYLEKSKDITVYIGEEVPKCEEGTFKKYIYKYKKGMARTIVFTIVGMIMGWMSIRYVSDSFIVTKIITAIPYKISEIIYGFLYEPPYIYLREGNAFFPQAQVVSFMAERLTPVLIGGAIYGSLGYFTGDRRIFTFKKYIKFAMVWSSIILIWIASMFVVNEWCLIRNNRLEGINGFFLYAESHGSRYAEDTRSEKYDVLKKSFGDVEKLTTLDPEEIKRSDAETRIDIWMGLGRCNIATVNWEEKFMILEDGRTLSITDEFAKLVKDFYYSTGFFEEVDVTVEEVIIEEIIAEEERDENREIEDEEAKNEGI